MNELFHKECEVKNCLVDLYISQLIPPKGVPIPLLALAKSTATCSLAG